MPLDPLKPYAVADVSEANVNAILERKRKEEEERRIQENAPAVIAKAREIMEPTEVKQESPDLLGVAKQQISAFTTNDELKAYQSTIIKSGRTSPASLDRQREAYLLKYGNPEQQKAIQASLVARQEVATTNQLAGVSPEMQALKEQQAKFSPTSLSGKERAQSVEEQRRIAGTEQSILQSLTQRRDALWDEEKKKMERGMREAKLGIEQEQWKRAPLETAIKETELAIKEAQVAGLPAEAKKKELDNLKLDLEIQEKEMENQQTKYLNDMLGLTPDTPAGVSPTTPSEKTPEQTITEIKTATTPDKVKLTKAEIETAIAPLGVDEDTMSKLAVSALNSSYLSPVELAVDVGVAPPPLYTKNDKNYSSVISELKELGEQYPISPDDMVEKVLKRRNIDPKDPKNSQFALDAATAVWDTYSAMGQEALIKAQDAITKSQNEALIGLQRQLPDPRTLTTQAVIAAQSDLLAKAKQAVNVAAIRSPAMKELMSAKVVKQFGLQNIDGMSEDAIMKTLLAKLSIDNSGNPAMRSLIADTMQKIDGRRYTEIDPGLQQYFKQFVAAFQPLAEKAAAELARKKQLIETENEKNELTTVFASDGTVKVEATFGGLDRKEKAEVYSRADSAKRLAMQEAEKIDTTRRVKSANVAGEYKTLLDNNEGWISAIEESGIHNQIIALETQKANMTAFEAKSASGKEKQEILDQNIKSLERQLTYRRGQYIPERVLDEMSALERFETLDNMKLAILGDSRLTPEDKRKLHVQLGKKIVQAAKEATRSEQLHAASASSAEELKEIWQSATEIPPVETPLKAEPEPTKQPIAKPIEPTEERQKQPDGTFVVYDIKTKKPLRRE